MEKVEQSFPTGKRQGFASTKGSYVKNKPEHLLSGSLRCDCCRGSIGLVSGQGTGYYGYINAKRNSCSNRLLVSRTKTEERVIRYLSESLLTQITVVFDSIAQAIKKNLSHILEEIRHKRLEINSTETKLKKFYRFCGEWTCS